MVLYDEAADRMGKAHCIRNLGKVALYQHGYADSRHTVRACDRVVRRGRGSGGEG